MSTVFNRFFALNKRASTALRTRLNLEDESPFWDGFHDLIEACANNLPDKAAVVDLGGGKSCAFVDRIPRDRGIRIIAVDISAEELAANKDVDECRVADVSKLLPFDDSEVDMIVSNALLEHVDGVPHAVSEMGRVLRPGGTALHYIPCRNALFALAARTLPFEPLKRLLHFVSPESAGVVEFDIHYDSGLPRTMRKLFRAAGFADVEISVCYSQSGYFLPILPLYIPVAAYQAIVRALRLESLGAYMIVRATR